MIQISSHTSHKFFMFIMLVLEGLKGLEGLQGTAYVIPCHIGRRHFISSCIAGITLRKQFISSAEAAQDVNDDNPPLSAEEMKEYEKLLKEAERIKNIIDLNIKAADEELKIIESKRNNTK